MKKLGRPKKIKEAIENQEIQVEAKEEVLAPVQAEPEKPSREPVRFVDTETLSDADRIAESRKSLNQALQPGQQFFEAPDGEIIIGDAEKTAVWSRRMNKGKGGWVNPRRV
jgi:hypothetical protein